MAQEKIIVPRSFYLLDELERAEKGKLPMTISLGLTDANDISLSSWQCTILGPDNTGVENRILSLQVYCGPQYPRAPPSVKFLSKVHLACVDSVGNVDPKKVSVLKNWNSDTPDNIEGVLVGLRKEFSLPAEKKKQQPPEGTMY